MSRSTVKSTWSAVILFLLLLGGTGCGKPKEAMQAGKKTKTVYLVKANNDLISHCACSSAIIGAPAQMDCPWCGCGWLFVCPKCRKAFTFARAEEVELSWEELAHRDLDGKWGRQPTATEVEEWISFMKAFLKDLKIGKDYVYIDGRVFATASKNLRFDGVYARHQLDTVPQADALKDRNTLERTLDSEQYWKDRKLENH
jgi:hypothetical protein